MDMPDNAPLRDLSVLVTRPAEQAEAFCRMIEHAGGRALRFPLVNIVARERNDIVKTQLAWLADSDIAIFISANAVEYALRAIERLPPQLKIAAVGNATAARLRTRGIAVDIVPASGFNSEALLDCAELQQVSGKRIAIVRGVGGRELLATTLRQRGAEVRYIEVYQRQRPTTPLSALDDYQSCQLIVITSPDALHNLLALCDDTRWLFNTALVTNSQRSADLAGRLGFGANILVSPSPADEAMSATIKAWWQRRRDARQA